MKQLQATIYQRQQTNNSGVAAVDYPVSTGAVMGVLLPTGGTIVQRQYGLEYAGEFEFYTKRRNAGLIEGNRLVIGAKTYDIVGVRDYVKAITCLLKEVRDG